MTIDQWAFKEAVTSSKLNEMVDAVNLLTSGAVQQIAASTLTGAAATIDLTDIPATYSSLMLFLSVRMTRSGAAESMDMTFNGVTGTSYDELQATIVHNATLSTVTNAGTDGIVITSSGTDAVANHPAAHLVFIPNYKATTFYKPAFVFTLHRTAAGSSGIFIRAGGGVFLSTNAISRITFTPSTDNFATGSHVGLYGLP